MLAFIYQQKEVNTQREKIIEVTTYIDITKRITTVVLYKTRKATLLAPFPFE